MNYFSLRSEHIKIVIKRLNAFDKGYRQNLAIIPGEDGFSQESAYFIKAILNRKTFPFYIIYVDCTYSDNYIFLKNTAISLLNSYLKLSLPDLNRLINLSQNKIPRTTQIIKSLLQEKKQVDILKILEIINTFLQEKENARCIFVMEEFTNLEKYFYKPYENISKFIMLQTKCLFIFTSEVSSKAEHILGNKLNLLFGNFEKIRLGKPSYIDSAIFLKASLKKEFPPEFFSFLLDITGLNPLYINLLTQEIPSGNHFKANLWQIISRHIYNENSYFYQKFTNSVNILQCLSKKPFELIKIISAIANGYIRRKEIENFTGIRKNISLKLSKLIELSLVEKHGNIYKIKDDLFSFWFLNVFSVKTSFQSISKQKQNEIFKENFYRLLSSLEEKNNIPSTKKITQLFSLFRDDHVRINNEKLKLPYLRRTKLISSPKNNFDIFIGEGTDIVFTAIKKGRTEQEDIIEFIKKSRSLKGSNIHRFFITLSSITDTARLIAKEKKLNLLDIEKLNYILKIYRQPIILEQ